MVKQEPVNMKWQIILVFLPITTLFLGSLWAAYRVQKLRKLLIIILILTVISILLFPDETYYGETDYDEPDLTFWISFWFNPLDGYFDDIDLSIKIAWIIDSVIWFSVSTYYIHKWSKEWNQNIFHTGNFKSALT